MTDKTEIEELFGKLIGQLRVSENYDSVRITLMRDRIESDVKKIMLSGWLTISELMFDHDEREKGGERR